MDIWILPNTATVPKSSPQMMANNLVKWWKTKFLNGYKQFSVVECGDGKVSSAASDTEELLGCRLGSSERSEDDVNERLRSAACTTPPFRSPAPPTSQEPCAASPNPPVDGDGVKSEEHLKFEEFSCDVSVENGDNKSGQERQEFSFTLYDFDGHGKITKDDIAGLVTTIYEALGSSVKVPHYGSKTIKVKLTVSPEQRKHVSATIINSNQKEEDNDKSSIRYKRDLNITISQGRRDKRRHCHHHRHKKSSTTKKNCCNNNNNNEDVVQEGTDDSSSEASSPISSEDDEEDNNEDECSDNEGVVDNNTNANNNNNNNNNKTKRHHHRQKSKCQQQKNNNRNPRYTIPNLFLSSENYSTFKKASQKKRSGSLQRQELLEIIQANMDKNNLGFQTPRKHSTHVSPSANDRHQCTESHKHHHNSTPKHHKMATSPLQYLANIVDPTHFYVDLGSLQNTTQPNHCQYDKLIDAVMCVSNNKKISFNNNYNQNDNINKKCSAKKPRAATVKNNMAAEYQFLKYPMINDENKPKVSNTAKKTATPKKSVNNCVANNNCDAKNVSVPQQVIVTGHTSSPHHLRHRNRQEDQARAMAQVVRWLEQEFSSAANLKSTSATKNNKESIKSTHESFHHQNKEKNNVGSPDGVERHEHHHVHEHIHHHYHHYQDTPLVV